MLAGRETGLASGSHRAAAVLLGRVEAGEGRAAYLLVAFNQAVPLGGTPPRQRGFLFASQPSKKNEMSMEF